MENDKLKILKNTLFWGFVLWLFGYILGIIFFAFVAEDMIGWFITPLGVIVTLWVLFKKVERESLQCYIGVGVFWTVMAIVLDYLFIVLLFQSADYYKLDVYVYYCLTLGLPILVGWYKMKKRG